MAWLAWMVALCKFWGVTLIAAEPTTIPCSLGFVRFESYDAPGGSAVSDLTRQPTFPNQPRETLLLSSFDSRLAYPDDSHESYGARISGLFVPPKSGDWIFYLKSDDGSELYLSPDEDPERKALIAAEQTCCRDFSDNPSAPITLNAGQRYYIEALYKEGGGGDYCQVAAKLSSDPTDPNQLLPIPGEMLCFPAETNGVKIAFVNHPVSAELCLPSPSNLRASFSAGPGGCVVTNSNGKFEGTWTYSDTAGSWSTAGQFQELGRVPTTFLDCPEFVVQAGGEVGVRLVHRYSFEFSDNGGWDGGQVQMSVNGGQFVPLAANAFIQNGYPGSIKTISKAMIAGQPAFVSDSPGYAARAMIESVAVLGGFRKGDRIVIRLAAAFDTNTRAGVPAWEVKLLELLEGSVGVEFLATVSVVNSNLASPPVLIQWQRSQGGGFTTLPGATGPRLRLATAPNQNGACFRAVAFTLGGSATSQVACLTLHQPNTPPSFRLGPDQAVPNSAGPTRVADWATEVAPHNIVGSHIAMVRDFAALKPGEELFGSARLDGGVLKLLNAGETSAFGALSGNMDTDRPISHMKARWRSLIGGGFGGGDGYSFSLRTRPPEPPTFGTPGEEGTSTGLSVTVDTFENSPQDIGIEIRWNGQRVAYQAISKDDEGSGQFLRKSVFVDALVELTPDGVATFAYDGNLIRAALPGFAGLRANEFIFAARSGGLDDNHWMDDLRIEADVADAAALELSQQVEFFVQTDRPDLFVALPALSPSGDLSYEPDPKKSGRARVSVMARDSGDELCNGRNQSETKEFLITTSFCPSTQDISIDALATNISSFSLAGSDPDDTNLLFNIISNPIFGTVKFEEQTGRGSYLPRPGSCGIERISFSVSDGICTALGTLVVTNGCPPKFVTCPASTILRSSFGDINVCGAVSNLIGTLQATGFPEPSISCRLADGTLVTPETIYPLGTNRVICTASNRFGTQQCEFTVTVIDRSPPLLSVRDWVVLVPPGVLNADVPYLVRAEDPCDGVVETKCDPPGTRFPLGTTLVQCSATDRNRQLGLAFFRVTVTNTPSFVPADLGTQEDLPGLAAGTASWADLDQDGRLDLLLSGSFSGGSDRRTRLYRNASNNSLIRLIPDLHGSSVSSVGWADYDLDGDLDLLTTGGAGDVLTRLYRNEGGGAFTAVESGLPNVSEGAIAWGDFDQDGRPDLVILGETAEHSRITRVFRNCPGGGFVDRNAALPGLAQGRAAWADFDRDGRLDLAVIGSDEKQPWAAIFRGDGTGSFVETNRLPVAVRSGALAWGDWNADGFPDLAVMGNTGTRKATAIYRNDPASGGRRTFTRILSSETRLPDASDGDLLWADFDNDGKLDLALAGSTRLSPTGRHAGVYLGNGEGLFSLMPAVFPDVDRASLAAGDFDNDGRVDLLVAGDTGTNQVARLFLNRTSRVNTSPTPPKNLSAALTPQGILLSWDPSVDSPTTSASALSYQVRIQGPTESSWIVSPDSLPNGRRLVPGIGQAGPTNRWILAHVSLPTGVYSWSVQAIDPAFSGSAFSTNATFLIEQPVLERIQTRADGTVHLTFTGSNHLYQVEAAASVIECGQTKWVRLGTANRIGNREHEFIDTQGLTFSNRFYRLVWP